MFLFLFSCKKEWYETPRNKSCGRSSLSDSKPGLALCCWLPFAYFLPSSLSTLWCGPSWGRWPEVNCFLIPSGNSPSLTPSMILHCPKVRSNVGPALEALRIPLRYCIVVMQWNHQKLWLQMDLSVSCWSVWNCMILGAFLTWKSCLTLLRLNVLIPEYKMKIILPMGELNEKHKQSAQDIIDTP